LLIEDEYESAKRERQEHLEAVLLSKSPKKIVVAGPGTGKTHLFKEQIREKKNCLTLSFVNSLVGDLSLDLCGMSEVKTLHGYARSALAVATRTTIELYPKLAYVMRSDAKVFLDKDIDFEKIFHTRDDGNENLGFYRDRRRYYSHYGFTDIIFSAVTYFEVNRDRLPVYDQVVVDEFQDFNPLEVSLIDLLSEKSPILIAGDDDQALYDFKNASAEHIRAYHGAESPYETFTLPFCSRSTKVIVEAANDIISAAKKYGLLVNRIDKPYRYFPCKEKDSESQKHSNIGYKQVYAKQIPWFIAEQVFSMAETTKRKFEVLVITPTATQCRDITEKLVEKGFENVSFIPRAGQEPLLIDGLMLIAAEPDSILGWRIVAECLLDEAEFVKVLKQAGNEQSVVSFFDVGTRDKVRKYVKTLKQSLAGEVREKGDLENLAQELGISGERLVVGEIARVGAIDSSTVQGAIRSIPIKVTTVQSSKGLAADLVLIVNFDDQYFIRDRDKKISNQDVCSFLVALTRARQKIVLISSARVEPNFLGWIDKARVQRL